MQTTGTPAGGAGWRTCVCSRILQLAADIREFRLELDDPAGWSFVPGQLVRLACPEYGGRPTVERTYSIASDPHDHGAVELIVRRAPGGICTSWLFEGIREGEKVRMRGPFGRFRLSGADTPMIFVAGGSGIAPLRSILYGMRRIACRRRTDFFFGANRVSELVCADLMHQFEKDLPFFRYIPVVAGPEGDWNGERGLVTEAVARNIVDASLCEGYLCGSPGMIDAAVLALKNLGMPADRIFFDKFA